MDWRDAEETARQYLQKWFRQDFSKKKLSVGTAETPLHREFDAVSVDGRIVAMVKDYKQPEPQKIRNVMEDVEFLRLVRAEKKLMFLTDPIFYVAFCRAKQGDLVELRRLGIEFVSPFELTKY